MCVFFFSLIDYIDAYVLNRLIYLRSKSHQHRIWGRERRGNHDSAYRQDKDPSESITSLPMNANVFYFSFSVSMCGRGRRQRRVSVTTTAVMLN